MSIATSVILRDQSCSSPARRNARGGARGSAQQTQRIDTDDVRAEIGKEKRAV
jgi:hypothetical protein